MTQFRFRFAPLTLASAFALLVLTSAPQQTFAAEKKAKHAITSTSSSKKSDARRSTAKLSAAEKAGGRSARAKRNSSESKDAPETKKSRVRKDFRGRMASKTKLNGSENTSNDSFANSIGLRKSPDTLSLQTSAAIIIDAKTQQVVYAKNAQTSLPMASITKLMTALLVVESDASKAEELTITADDVDTEKKSSSRLPVGTRLTRGEMLHLALMSSENRAAHALARSHPGGIEAFISAMNAKAKMLGMTQTRYVDPTGLSNGNRASPMDIAKLAQAASVHEEMRRLTTSKESDVDVLGRRVHYRSSNEFVRSGAWDIVLQKTGYIREAGRCMVMEVKTAGRMMVMVVLDSVTPVSRRMDLKKMHQFALEKAPLIIDSMEPSSLAPRILTPSGGVVLAPTQAAVTTPLTPSSQPSMFIPAGPLGRESNSARMSLGAGVAAR